MKTLALSGLALSLAVSGCASGPRPCPVASATETPNAQSQHQGERTVHHAPVVTLDYQLTREGEPAEVLAGTTTLELGRPARLSLSNAGQGTELMLRVMQADQAAVRVQADYAERGGAAPQLNWEPELLIGSEGEGQASIRWPGGGRTLRLRLKTPVQAEPVARQ